MQPGILTRSLSSPFSSSSSHQLPHKGATTAYQGFAALPAIAKYPNGARGENALLIEALKDEILQFAESLGLPSRTASSSSSLDEVLFITLRALKSKYPKCLSRFEDSDACESIKKDLHQLYRVLNFVKDFSDERCNKFAKLNDDGTLNSLNFELIGKRVLEMLKCSNTPQMREMFESAETSIETESSSVGKKRKLIHESSKPKPIPILRENPRAGSSKPEPIPILRENPRAGLILKDFSDNKPYLTPRLRPLRLQSLGRLTPVPPYCVVPLASSPNIGSLRDSDKPKDDLKHDDLDDSWGMDHGCQTFRMEEDEENEDDRPSHEDSFVLMSEPPSNRRKRVEAPVTPSASPAFALFHQRMMFPIDTTPTPPSSPMFLTGMPMFFQSCRPEMDGVPYAMIIDNSSIENYDSDETKQFIVGTPPTNGIVGTPMIFELATPRATSPMAPPMQFALQSPQKDVSLASTPPPLPARSISTIKSAPAPPELPGKRNDLSMRVAPPPTPPPLPPSITTNSSPKVSAQPPPPPPPPPRANNSIVTKGPLPPPLPQSRLSKESSSTNVPSRPTPPPPPGSSLKGPAPPPPPPGGAARALRAIKATKLKRSSQMGNLYRLLKGKVEGSSLEGKTSHAKKGQGGGSSGGKGGQGMADALAEMTKRSAYFQQIEEDVAKHAKSILELKNELTKFQSKDMAELVKFHKHVEQRLECLTDETQVLARFEGFPSKKLECLRMAAALYAKLDGIVSSIKNWKLISPVVQQLDKIETRFNKIKEEMDVIERTKDDENKRFKAQNIDFDFTILVRIKESMVDLSSNCIELALKESKDAKEEATTGGTPTTGKNQANGAGVSKMLWRAFQLAFRVYNFAGGQDERADRLTAELANEIETFRH